MRNWDRLAFLAGLAVVVFLVGVELGGRKAAPYREMQAVKTAARSLVEQFFPSELPEFPTRLTRGGVMRWEKGATEDGLTLMTFRVRDGGGAILVDMDGRELHRWSLEFGDAFPETPHLLARSTDDRVFWHGMHLYPNGDLLVNYEGGNFPTGSGLLLMDKDSKVKWKLLRNTHHDLDVMEDGRIAVLAHRYLADGVPACADFFIGPYLADEVLIVGADGKEQESFSLLEALCDSDWRGTLMPRGAYRLKERPPIETDDPLHANGIDVLTPAEAANFPNARAGDYLISMRHLNLVALVDKDTHRVKWGLDAHFVRQHDPDVLPNGDLLVFDNLGGPPGPAGRSRILEIDPRTQAVVWSYAGTPEDPFDSPFLGKQVKLANGNVLIASPPEGRVFEVTGDAQPRVVWEYVNFIEAKGDGGIVGYVGDPQRYAPEELPFLGSPP